MKLFTGKGLTVAAVTIAVAGAMGTGLVTAQDNNPTKMSFFVTSAGSGEGGDLGGLAGADARCTQLARAAGSPEDKVWRAYLSATAADGQAQVDARDRIGTGPWYNAKGEEIAANVDDLHGENPKWTKQSALTETGLIVAGRGDSPNTHDILTGSTQEGRLAPVPAPAAPAAGAPAGAAPAAPPANMTCNNWTSSETTGVAAMVGHSDRSGGNANGSSINAAHASRGCSQANLVQTGGTGRFYCFATN